MESSSDMFVKAESCSAQSSASHPDTPTQEPALATHPPDPLLDVVSERTRSAVQNNPTENCTEWRKCHAAKKAVKRCFKKLITKMCPCVSSREPSQERPHTSSQEMNAQPSTSIAVPTRTNPTGSPTNAPKHAKAGEKKTKARKDFRKMAWDLSVMIEWMVLYELITAFPLLNQWVHIYV